MKKSQYPIAGTCMILSFIVALQFKSVTTNEEYQEFVASRTEDLQINLQKEREKVDQLYTQVEYYRQQLDEYTKEAEKAGGYASALANRLEDTLMIAGLTDVEGPGVIVTIDDSKKVNKEGYNENNFLVHDEDLLRVINEIRGAGAEAISINGERIISTTEIRCAGATVSVNNTRYSAPYVIKAIGNAEDIENALSIRQGVVELLGQWGIEVSIKTQENVSINAYNGITTHKYASSVKVEE